MALPSAGERERALAERVQRRRERIEVDVLADVEVEHAVAIGVEEREARRPQRRGALRARRADDEPRAGIARERHGVFPARNERAVRVLQEHDDVAEAARDEVRVSVAVEIARREPGPPAREPRALRAREAAASVVLEHLEVGARSAREARERVEPLREHDVEVAVVPEVEERDARAVRLEDRAFLRLARAIHVVEPACSSFVDEVLGGEPALRAVFVRCGGVRPSDVAGARARGSARRAALALRTRVRSASREREPEEDPEEAETAHHRRCSVAPRTTEGRGDFRRVGAGPTRARRDRDARTGGGGGCSIDRSRTAA